MTNRQVFEAWAKSVGAPFYYADINTYSGSAWSIWQAAKATEPRWHDAPTEPGLWVCVDKLNGALTYTVTPDNLTRLHNAGDRWFGPIPEDKP